MNKVLLLIQESMTFYYFNLFLTSLKNAVKSSCIAKTTLSIYHWFQKHIATSKLYQYIFVPTHITNAWYKSIFYRYGTYGIRKLSLVMPKPSFKWSCLYIGGFATLILFIPSIFWSDLILQTSFIVLAIFYFGHFAYSYSGMSFGLLNLLLVVFWGVFSLAIPYSAAKALALLLMGIDFFFLVSFSVRTKQDFDKMLCCIYMILVGLCVIGFVQQAGFSLSAKATLPDGVTFGEIIILLFPFAFIYPIGLDSFPRRLSYMALLISLSFYVVAATGSRAALIGYVAELILLILFIDRRYLPLLLFLSPALMGNAVENIANMWHQPKTYGNFFANIFYSFKNFWDNGFGVNRSAFMSIYQTTAQNANNIPFGSSFIPSEVSRTYFLFLVDAGAVMLIAFLTYILKLAHSAFTSIFTAPGKYKPYFAAGFVTLIGISVSSLFESAFFNSRVLIIYWGTLGLLRAARIIRFGIIDRM